MEKMDKDAAGHKKKAESPKKGSYKKLSDMSSETSSVSSISKLESSASPGSKKLNIIDQINKQIAEKENIDFEAPEILQPPSLASSSCGFQVLAESSLTPTD
jgi:hypothetical protein